MPSATISPVPSVAAAAFASTAQAPAAALAPPQGFADLVDAVAAELPAGAITPGAPFAEPAALASVEDLPPIVVAAEPETQPLPTTPAQTPDVAATPPSEPVDVAIVAEAQPLPAATPAPAADAPEAAPILATAVPIKLRPAAEPTTKDSDKPEPGDAPAALVLTAAVPLPDPASPPPAPIVAIPTPQPQAAPVAVQVAAVAMPPQPQDEPAASVSTVDLSEPLATTPDRAPAAPHAALRTAAPADAPVPASVEAPEGLPAPLFSQAFAQPVSPDQLLAGIAYAPEKAAPATPMVRARAGQIGRDMGAVIARQVVEGRDQVTVRLAPPEMGRVDVRLSFDHARGLRAIVATESPAAMDLLRRDMGDLNRALADAGIRTDADSFRFDRSPSGGGFAQPDHSRRNPQGASAGPFRNARGELPAEPAYRPLRTSGGVDMIA